MSLQVVKIRKEALGACMKCPLCHNLLKHATTISICLHTFCRKCIYEKLSDEEEDTCCPVCEIDLGCVPIEKLRQDHSLQDIRATIFPSKRSKIKSPEVTPLITPPVKRKERSLSSLVAPKVSSQSGVTGKRSKFGPRKSAPARPSNFSIEKPAKNDELASVDSPDSSNSDETLNKNIQDEKQASPPTMPLPQQLQKKDDDGHMEIEKPSADLWKPLNFLVEAANRTKLPKPSPQDLHLEKPEPPASTLESVSDPKLKGKEEAPKENLQVDQNGKPLIPGVVKRRRRRANPAKNFSPQTADSQGTPLIKRTYPVWLSLVALEDQERDIPLAQASTCYLRILDGDLPVSYIQKYLVKKLGLKNESEVDILCHGQPVIPSLGLRSLIELWSQIEPQTKKRTRVGNTAKEFVMPLSYSRKIGPSLG